MKKFLIVSNVLFASTVVFGMDQRQAISDQQLCSMVVTAFQQQKSDNNVPQSKWSPELWEKIISKASQEKEYFNIPRNSEEWTLLMYATKYSTLEIVEKLLKLKDSSGCKLIDIDAQRKKMTALAIAILDEDIDKIRLLLKYGSDVYKNHLFDIDAPKLAAMRGCPEILSIFEDQVNNDLQLISSAAFCEAQDVNAIKELLKSGAYINYQLDRNINDNVKKSTNKNAQGRTPLMSVIGGEGEARYDIFRLLLSHPDIDVNLKDAEGKTPLLLAIAKGDLRMVKELLAFRRADGMRVRVNERISKDYGSINIIVSAAYYAENNKIIKNYADILRELIRAGMDLSFRGEQGITLLFDDVLLSMPIILEAFLSERDNSLSARNARLNKQILGLIDAKYRGYKLSDKDIRGWLDHVNPLDINDQNNEWRITALMSAVSNGHEESTRLLLNQDDIQIYLKDIFGHTALSRAVAKGYEDITEMLLQKYDRDALAAEIDEQDRFGNTLWKVACNEGNLTIMNLILDHLPEDVRNNKISYIINTQRQILDTVASIIKEATPQLEQAPESIDHVVSEEVTEQKEQQPEQVVKQLTQEERNKIINQKFKDSIIEVNTSEEKDREEKIKSIKALLNAKDTDGNRIVTVDSINFAVMAASGNGDLEIVTKLLIYRPDINLKDNDGNTPLMMAAQSGHYHVIPALLQYYNGKNINLCNKDKFTALMLAAKNGHVETVRMLANKYKAKNRDINQALKVVRDKIKNLKKNQIRNNSNISVYKSIEDILDVRQKESEKNDERNVEKIDVYWPVLFSGASKGQLEALEQNEEYIYDNLKDILLQLSFNPFDGKAKKLASGLWSRKINDEHRLVYDIDGNEIHIVSCEGHYSNNVNKRSRQNILSGVKFPYQWKNGKVLG